MNELPPITTLILAGGRGSRLNGKDKGLVSYAGKPLIEHCLETVSGLSEQLIISCNRNQAQYKLFCENVVSDANTHFDGPLAGISAASAICASEYLFTLPCDMPFVSASCAYSLAAALEDSTLDIAVAHDGSRRQSLVMIVRKHCLSSIQQYLHAGNRRVDTWQNSWQVAEVDCSDESGSFRNLNTETDFNHT